MIYRFLIILNLILFCLFISCSESGDNPSKSGKHSSGNWPIFRGNSALTGYIEQSISSKLKILWRFQTEDDIKSSPVIFENIVYVGSDDGNLYALQLNDGRELWRFKTDDAIEAPPLIIGGSIFLGALDGTFYCIDPANGKQKWQLETESQISGSATYVTDPGKDLLKILVGSYDNHLYCINANSGNVIWKYETENYINGAAATDGNVTVFGGCDSKLHILDAGSGEKIGDVETGSYIAGSAALYDNHAYLGHYGNQVISIDIENKQIKWTYEADEKSRPFFSSPAVNDKYVIIGSRDDDVHCIDRKTGEPVWRFRTRDEVDSSPVICGNKVIAASMDGWLYLLDIHSGKQIWSFEIGGSITSCPAVSKGMIIIGSDDGNIYAFGEDI